jgi:hypothetical protein
MFLMQEKICMKCNIAKPVTEFYRHSEMKTRRLNKCRTCTKIENKAWRDNTENRARWNEGRHRRKLFLDFGITPDAYDELYRAPRCAGCGLTKSVNGKKLVLDHDHKTGAVRGLLCHDCNRTIATAHDDPGSWVSLENDLEINPLVNGTRLWQRPLPSLGSRAFLAPQPELYGP